MFNCEISTSEWSSVISKQSVYLARNKKKPEFRIKFLFFKKEDIPTVLAGGFSLSLSPSLTHSLSLSLSLNLFFPDVIYITFSFKSISRRHFDYHVINIMWGTFKLNAKKKFLFEKKVKRFFSVQTSNVASRRTIVSSLSQDVSRRHGHEPRHDDGLL